MAAEGYVVDLKDHVEVGVMTSTVLLVLDLRDPAGPPIQLALVLGMLLLWGDWPSPVRRGGVGAAEAEVSIGGGTGLVDRGRGCAGGMMLYRSCSMA